MKHPHNVDPETGRYLYLTAVDECGECGRERNKREFETIGDESAISVCKGCAGTSTCDGCDKGRKASSRRTIDGTWMDFCDECNAENTRSDEEDCADALPRLVKYLLKARLEDPRKGFGMSNLRGSAASDWHIVERHLGSLEAVCQLGSLIDQKRSDQVNALERDKDFANKVFEIFSPPGGDLL